MGTWLSKKKLTIKGLEADEQRFAETLIDGRGKQHREGVASLEGVVRLEPGHSDHYYKEKVLHTGILLHNTVGYLSGDLATLTSKKKVSVAYVVARNGTVYELFDPDYWSFHVGPGCSGLGNTAESKRLIGIEVSNFGPLTEHPTKSDILLDAYSFPYCMKSDTDYYVQKTHRGYDYFATFTDQQYRALDSLLLRLCRKFDIKHNFVHHSKRLDYFETLPDAGILTHSNYRKDKVDIGPAFDWMRISGR